LSNVKDNLAQAREVFIKNTPSGMNPSGVLVAWDTLRI
jgi:hypothetical protein